MASIPLALHFLDKEHFGLWALAAQVNGYLCLIDLGMTGAISRFIADYKDDVNGGEYGSHLLTGGLVYTFQGGLIAFVGIGFSWFAPALFAIPTHLTSDFRGLLMLLAGMTGLSVALRSVGAPLWAFQRSDVVNNCATLGTIASLFLLWFGFRSGWGVFGFAIAQVPSLLGSPLVHFWVCNRNDYYPARGRWGKPSHAIFKCIFHFGKDNLLINVGSQLINASQIMIISRCVGLDAAATFAVATKVYNMGMLLVANPIAAAAPGLTELHVRGETKRFVQRYWELIALTLAASTFIAICLAAGNRSFISIWTHGAIDWPWSCDLVLAVFIVIKNLNGCFIGLFGLTKDWRPVRFIYLLEGLVFIPVAILSAIHFGIVGVLVASLMTHFIVNTTFSVHAASRILGSPARMSKGLAVSFCLIAAAAAIAWAGSRAAANNFGMLAATAGSALVSIAAIWSWMLPDDFRKKLGLHIANSSIQIKTLLRRTN
jgi:O-antigen/teichoic acid export membrane protein